MEKRGVRVELRLLEAASEERKWFDAGSYALTLLLGAVTGGREREVLVRIRDAEGIERETFTTPSWKQARKRQSEIVAALRIMTESDIDLNHRRQSWHEVS